MSAIAASDFLLLREMISKIYDEKKINLKERESSQSEFIDHRREPKNIEKTPELNLGTKDPHESSKLLKAEELVDIVPDEETSVYENDDVEL